MRGLWCEGWGWREAAAKRYSYFFVLVFLCIAVYWNVMYHQLAPHLPFQPGDCQSKGRGQGNGTNPGNISVFPSVGHLSSRRAIGSARSVINWRQQNPRGRIRCGTEIIQHICPILSVLYLSYSLNIIFVQLIQFIVLLLFQPDQSQVVWHNRPYCNHYHIFLF